MHSFHVLNNARLAHHMPNVYNVHRKPNKLKIIRKYQCYRVRLSYFSPFNSLLHLLSAPLSSLSLSSLESLAIPFFFGLSEVIAWTFAGASKEQIKPLRRRNRINKKKWNSDLVWSKRSWCKHREKHCKCHEKRIKIQPRTSWDRNSIGFGSCFNRHTHHSLQNTKWEEK